MKRITAVLFAMLSACTVAPQAEKAVAQTPARPVVENKEEAKVSDNACPRLVEPTGPFERCKAFEKGLRLFERKKYADALNAFEHAMATCDAKDENDSAVALAAYAALQQKNWNKALEYAENLSDKNDFSPYAARWVVESSFNAGLYDKTLRYADKAYGNKKNNPDIDTYVGIAYHASGQFDKAEETLSKIKKFPKSLRPKAMNALADARLKKNAVDAALETLKKIYELDPKSPEAALAKDQIMALEEQWPPNFVFPPAPKLSPKDMDERSAALALFNAHESEKAIKAYTALKNKDKKNGREELYCEDLLNIGRSYVKLRKHADALKFYEQGFKDCEKSTVYLRMLYLGAKAAWNAHKNQRALDLYKEIVDRYPKHSYADDALHYSARIFISEKRTQDALKTLDTQIRQYPDGDMAKDSHWLIFQIHYENNDFEKSAAFAEKYHVNRFEDDLYSRGRLAYFLGRSYEKIGKKDQAVKIYHGLRKDFPDYFSVLAFARLQKLDASHADWLDAARAAYKASPQDALRACFSPQIARTDAFRKAQRLTSLRLYNLAADALQNLPDDIDDTEKKFALSILDFLNGDYAKSAKSAAKLPLTFPYLLLAYPTPFNDIVEKSTETYRLPKFLVHAVMREESFFNPAAVSWAQARGLMQLMYPTAVSTASANDLPKPSEKDLFKPDVAIPIGAAYLSKLLGLTANHTILAIPAYNAGQGNVLKWVKNAPDTELDFFIELIPFKEAREYAKRVYTTFARYHYIYGEKLRTPDPAASVSQMMSPSNTRGE